MKSHPPGHITRAAGQPFPTPLPGIEIHEIINGNTRYLDEFIDVFKATLSRYSFSIPTMRKYARNSARLHFKFLMHQWLFRIHDQPAGMTVFMYNNYRNLGFGLYLSLLPQFRKYPVGQYTSLAPLIIELTRDQVRKDAVEAGNPPPDGYVAEVLQPELVNFYKRNGFFVFPIDYYAAYLDGPRENLLPVDFLSKMEFHIDYLGVFAEPGSTADFLNRDYLSNVILSLTSDFYGIPEEHWTVRKTMEMIQNLSPHQP